MHSVKKVKKVLAKTLPRYYLRSRKRYAPLFKPVVSVADQETQADLSDEDREALFAELPFHFLSSPESDTEVEEHLNTSPSYTYQIPQVPETSRRSTAFCTPLKAKLQISISEISASIATTNPLCARATLKNNFTTHTHPGLASNDRISSAHFTLNIQKGKVVIPILTTNQTIPLTVEITSYNYRLWWLIRLPI